MAKKKQKKEKRIKTISIKLDENKKVFNIFLKPIIPFGMRQDGLDYNLKVNEQVNLDPQLSQIKRLRQLLSKEKIKIIHTIKEKKPSSIYELAKILKRNFKAVRQDLRLFENFGLIELKKEKIKNRVCSRPVLKIDMINFSIEL
jgi:hypothetical protein